MCSRHVDWCSFSDLMNDFDEFSQTIDISLILEMRAAKNLDFNI